MDLALHITNTLLLIGNIFILRGVGKRIMSQIREKKESVPISYSTESPNEVTTVKNDDLPITEGNPIAVGESVKFEIEGGDSVIPPEFA